MKFDFSKFKYNGKDIMKKINLPSKPTPELAEIIGIMLGDGSLYSYLNYVKNLFEEYFYPYKFSLQELENEFLMIMLK
ncbi:hypothetical protein HYW19_02150 [Candidatus Woesearchaeota archaeon]|nr:hypothetical protein [Candidatus Woesearchaeota archaeon]